MTFDELREQMFETQMKTWFVSNERVFEILRTIKRENFVPSELQGQAFCDRPLPINNTTQSMFLPSVEGRLLETLCEIGELRSTLLIGSGSGYFAALCAQLAEHVLCLEIDESIAHFSEKNLFQSGVKNVSVENVDAFDYGFGQELFSTVIICGSLTSVFSEFLAVCEPDAHMICFEGSFPSTTAVCLSRNESSPEWQKKVLFDYYVSPIINKREDKFSF